MTNLAYCRFQNTLTDLRDCVIALDSMDAMERMSQQEWEGFIDMIGVCGKIYEDYKHLLGK